MGHAARLFLPSGQVFASRRVTFFLRAQKKSNQKKTAPCGAFRITSDPLRSFPQFVCIGGGRGGAALKLVAHQPCHLKPPRKICLTHNPLGAIRNSLEKHPSLATLLGLSSPVSISEGRGTLCETWDVSAAAFVANRLLSAGGYIMLLKCQLCLAFCQLVG